MAAYCAATVNEDGTIEPEVMVTPMDPDEYKMRVAKINVRPSAVRALETLADLGWNSATVRMAGQAEREKCDICGADAGWRATSWMRSYEVTLCHDHMQARIDQYKSFDRI